MNKPLWSTISIYLDGEAPAPLVGRDRLAVLFLWLRGEAPSGARFFELAGERAVLAPADVGWQGFPLEDALDAADEMRRRRADDLVLAPPSRVRGAARRAGGT